MISHAITGEHRRSQEITGEHLAREDEATVQVEVVRHDYGADGADSLHEDVPDTKVAGAARAQLRGVGARDGAWTCGRRTRAASARPIRS